MTKTLKISAYNLACGGIQREELNGHWVELYRESNCYHVRMGEIGEKWSEWETFDSGDKSPLKLARECYAEFKKTIKNLHEYLYIIDLNERGFFKAHVEDKNDSSMVVFSLTNDPEQGGLWLVDDGFMKHVEDTENLLKYLIDMDILPKDATLKKGN